MKTNITFIGMPGAGKSTTGIILAKYLSYGFVDTDILIQINHQKSLQAIINESDYLHLRKIEENEILKLNVDNHVVATGGSAVYSQKAMTHLRTISVIVFLRVAYGTLCTRIRNFRERGISKPEHQSFLDLHNERQGLYEQYADLIIDADSLDQESIALSLLNTMKDNGMQTSRAT